MAKFIDRWFERITTRFPYFTPVILLLMGLGAWGYAASLGWEVWEMGQGSPLASEPTAVEAANLAGSGAQGDEPAADPENRQRLRKYLLMTGSGILTVMGGMSLSFSGLWFWLIRVQLNRMESPQALPNRFN